MQVSLGEAVQEPELHAQTAGDPGTLPARGDRDPVLLRGGHGGAGERAGRPVRAHPDRGRDLLRAERVELRPGELEYRLDAAGLDGDFPGGQPQRVGTGRRREQRAEEQRSEETAGGHGARPPYPGSTEARPRRFRLNPVGWLARSSLRRGPCAPPDAPRAATERCRPARARARRLGARGRPVAHPLLAHGVPFLRLAADERWVEHDGAGHPSRRRRDGPAIPMRPERRSTSRSRPSPRPRHSALEAVLLALPAPPARAGLAVALPRRGRRSSRRHRRAARDRPCLPVAADRSTPIRGEPMSRVRPGEPRARPLAVHVRERPSPRPRRLRCRNPGRPGARRRRPAGHDRSPSGAPAGTPASSGRGRRPRR